MPGKCKCGKEVEFIVDCRIDEIRLRSYQMMYERIQRNLCRECYIKLMEILNGN